mmetsp:Transcript_16831/g.18756  ORF Transcript_16831/g.18756 Transcript_16831/m.18756 type:complete len:181 (-) Transcript_16831:277-819(-)
MRPLTDEEAKVVFEKLAKYIGRNIKLLVDRHDEPYCFRLHKERVYYVSEALMRRATSVQSKQLVAMGTCVGKFTHSHKFRMQVSFLDFLAQYAQYKVWLKPSAELSFLYGNNVVKQGLGRITENTPQHQGVLVLSMQSVPIGFGVTAYSTDECRAVDATSVVVYHQSDVGEFLRSEEGMV